MKYFIIAGEASGDLHASKLIKELKKKSPNSEFVGLGGDLMAEQGVTLVRHYKDMAFMGFVNVMLNIRKVLSNISACKNAILKEKPDVVILIDYPGFNLSIADFVKKNCKDIPVYYYIAPKLWAWKSYRIHQIKRVIDRMFVIFPFEIDYFKKFDYGVTYVGNPTVDSVKEFVESYTPKANSGSYIALLAGSRKQEIRKCLPVYLKVAERFSNYRFVIAGAPGIDKDFYSDILQNSNIEVHFGETYNLVKGADAAIVNSGTATLETALIGTPQVVIYHVIGGCLVPLLKKLLIKTEFISLVNIIAGKEVVKELYGPAFNVDSVTKELESILNDSEYRKTILSGYDDIITMLGNRNCAETVAAEIYNNLHR